MRAAIIGCGSIAQVHAEVLSSLEGVTLTACADIIPERARAFLREAVCPYCLHWNGCGSLGHQGAEPRASRDVYR